MVLGFAQAMNTSKQHARPALTSADLESLRRALETKRDELLQKRQRHIALLSEPDETALADPMDLATRSSDEGEAIGLSERERALFFEIEHALRKIDIGTYGLSERSGQAIPLDRLRAVPWARLTADEAEKLER
jgi:DnaK suppressor protein